MDRGSNRVRGWKVGVSKGKNDLVGSGIRTHAPKVQNFSPPPLPASPMCYLTTNVLARAMPKSPLLSSLYPTVKCELASKNGQNL